MRRKYFLTFFLILAFIFIGSLCYFRFSQAQTETPLPQGQPQMQPVDNDQKMLEKLDTILDNQEEIIARLQKLDQLVRTRKVD